MCVTSPRTRAFCEQMRQWQWHPGSPRGKEAEEQALGAFGCDQYLGLLQVLQQLSEWLGMVAEEAARLKGTATAVPHWAPIGNCYIPLQPIYMDYHVHGDSVCHYLCHTSSVPPVCERL